METGERKNQVDDEPRNQFRESQDSYRTDEMEFAQLLKYNENTTLDFDLVRKGVSS